MQNRLEIRGPGRRGAAAGSRSAELRDFVVRVAVVLGGAALLFLAWQARQALLLIFAAVVVAVIFDAAARPFRRWIGLPRRWALVLAALAIAAVLGLVGWLVGSRVSGQFDQVLTALRQAEPTARAWLGLDGGGSGASGGGGSGSVGSYIDWALSAASWGLGAVGAVTSLVLVIVAGYFLATEPGLYRRGVRMMFPKDQHARVEDALVQTGAGLFQWLLGQLVSMTLVGMLMGVGAWFIGLPAPVALGLFAGLADFVPVVGVIAGAVPALALAAAQGGSAILWTGALILAVQQLESNMIMPIVQRRTVSIPPALLLLAVFLFGVLFGGVGVIIASPLAVTAFVLIKKLYIIDTLDGEAELPAD